MRKIKFRAYLVDINKIVDIKTIDWDEDCNITCINYPDEEGNIISINYPEGKDCLKYEDGIVLMLYTGFKDKNGKEIYEGDIIKYRNNLYQVKWIFLDFHVHQINGGEFKKLDEFMSDKNKMDIEIVDNIYENTELFKKN